MGLCSDIDTEMAITAIARGVEVKDVGLSYGPQRIAGKVDQLAEAVLALAERVERLETLMSAPAMPRRQTRTRLDRRSVPGGVPNSPPAGVRRRTRK